MPKFDAILHNHSRFRYNKRSNVYPELNPTSSAIFYISDETMSPKSIVKTD